jgi:hypothetical protein
MSFMDVPTYRARERSWRDKAAVLPPGPDRETYTALADGYAHLVNLLETLEATDRQKVQYYPSHSAEQVAATKTFDNALSKP